MMYFIGIHGSYNQLEVALFQDATCLGIVLKNDIKASSHLIPIINQLLMDHDLMLANLSFIAVDCGPGAFTSLRVTIATVNGIAFAQHIPLMSVCGLHALYQEVLHTHKFTGVGEMMLCLLNAYNDDVYYLFSKQGATPSLGYKKIDDLCMEICGLMSEKTVVLAGDGVRIYKDNIDKILGNHVTLAAPFILFPSARQIGLMAYEMWLAGQRGDLQITPLYLKTQLFAVKK